MWAKYRHKFGSLNPIHRAEWDAGVIASTIANVNRDSKSAPYSPTDFTVHYNQFKPENEPISLADAMKAWT